MRVFLLIVLVASLSSVSNVIAQDDALPPCTPAEIDNIHASLAEMTAFFHRASAVRTTDDLLAYSDSHIEWRERYWTSTPLCAESYEIATLANQLIGDFVALVLVNSFEKDVEVNPYRAERSSARSGCRG